MLVMWLFSNRKSVVVRLINSLLVSVDQGVKLFQVMLIMGVIVICFKDNDILNRNMSKKKFGIGVG